MNHEISLRINVKLDEKVKKNRRINFQNLKTDFKRIWKFLNIKRIKKKVLRPAGIEPRTSLQHALIKKKNGAGRDRTRDPSHAQKKKKRFKRECWGRGSNPRPPVREKKKE